MIFESDLGKIERISTWLKIHDRKKKGPYFKYKERRYSLRDFVRFRSYWSYGKPKYYYEDDEKYELAGSDAVNYTGYIVEIGCDGESVRLYKEVTE